MTASMLGGMAREGRSKRPKGSIRRRGNSLQVSVYAGLDPLTGRRLYLTDSTTDEAEAERILTRLSAQVVEKRHARTKGTLAAAVDDWRATHDVGDTTWRTYRLFLDKFILPALGTEPVAKIDAKLLERFYADLRRCRRRCDGRPFVEHRVDGDHECRKVRHKRPPGRPRTKGLPAGHDCDKAGCVVVECKQHQCDPLPPGTISKIHYTLSSVFAASIRWGWIETNPCDVARKPKQPPPDPDPPTSEQAARIVDAAWSQDATWGTLVWLVMVTGMRRAEALALRWRHVDLTGQRLNVSRSYQVVDGKRVEKDTKTHQRRRPALDPATVEILTEHRQRYDEQMRDLGRESTDDAFLFSYEAAYDQPCNPDGVSHRYTRMCESIGITSHLHALRHYNATELLTSGVDLRTVAGRLGHAGGGATTLRVYTAWLNSADQAAANVIGGRFKRPGTDSAALDVTVPENLARNVRARWPARAQAWLDAVGDELSGLCASYSAVPEQVLSGRFALVVVARSVDDRSLALRASPDPQGEDQAVASRLLAEHGVAPRVHEVKETPTGTWVVMDHIQPGTPAYDCTRDELCDLLEPLVSASRSALDLPSLSGWLRSRLLSDMRADMYPGATAPTDQERAEALRLLKDLEPGEASSVCHGDMSLGNVIRGDRRLYLIDPRGVRGDAEYDVAVAAMKANLDVRALASNLRVDEDRAESWARVAIAARV